MTLSEIAPEVASGSPLISIVLPSFLDERITDAIASIRRFDDLDSTRIIIIDGGSGEELVKQIAELLTDRDILISAPDDGIFDGLNKGLALCDTPYIGWLGSDDLYSDTLKSSQVVDMLSDHDIYVGSLYLCDDLRIVRMTSSWMAGKGMVKYGLHNPHYATFGRSELFTKHQFEVKALAADIGYFLNVFSEKPRIAYSTDIFVLQAQGGFSIQSKRKIMQVNRNAYGFYCSHLNPVAAAFAVGLKLGYKLLGSLRYRLFPRAWDNQFPLAAELVRRRMEATSQSEQLSP